MLCSAGSGLQWFSRSLPSSLGTFCNWSWHSTQRTPWLMPFTSQLVPPAPFLHWQLPHCTTNLLPRTGTTQGQGLLSAPFTWVLNQCFSLAGRALSSVQGFSNTMQTYLLPLPQNSSSYSCLNYVSEKFKKFVAPAVVTSSSANARWLLYFALMLQHLRAAHQPVGKRDEALAQLLEEPPSHSNLLLTASVGKGHPESHMFSQTSRWSPRITLLGKIRKLAK